LKGTIVTREDDEMKVRAWMLIVGVTLGAAACMGSPERKTVVQEKGVAGSGAVRMSMESTPAPPVTGTNTVTIAVKAGDAPVDDATVTGEFFMPVMESMGKTNVQFTHTSDGRYTGQGNLSMAGAWQVTVTAMRAGQTLATRTFNLTTKE
jgi:hypothetical protein